MRQIRWSLSDLPRILALRVGFPTDARNAPLQRSPEPTDLQRAARRQLGDAGSSGYAAGGTVFTLGDHAYPAGTRQDFRDCYEPTWGRLKGRTRPVPGNHEYLSPGAQPYFEYFGANAGPAGLGYYSFPLGAWHAIALNSNIPVDAGSAQAAWLRTELATTTSICTLAYWHHPLFTSGPNRDNPRMRDFWRILGVLKLTLMADSYQWEFISVSGRGDSGTALCH